MDTVTLEVHLGAVCISVHSGSQPDTGKHQDSRLERRERDFLPQTAFVGFSQTWYREIVRPVKYRQACCRGYSIEPRGTLSWAKPSDDDSICSSGTICAQDILKGVVDRREFDGFWRDAEKLLSLAKRKVSASPDVPASDEFSTIVAIAILRAKCQDNATAWRIIEAKAIARLGKRGISLHGRLQNSPSKGISAIAQISPTFYHA
jgi:hypothetical protein